MQLLGQAVKHISFGKGVITDVSTKVVTVHFPQGEKRFLYPQAFAKFLTLKDEEKQEAINEKNRRRRELAEAERKREERMRERRIKLRTIKIRAESQAVFDMKQDETEMLLEQEKVFAGCYLSGQSKGMPRIPKRLAPYSGCLLTSAEGGAERERRILGIFMTREDYLGEYARDGMVKVHSKYKLEVPKEMEVSFWDYFKEDQVPARWGSVAFKYFSNGIMQKILLDMKKMLEGTKQEELAADFYQYFCRVNQLTDLSEKEGETI